MKLHYLMLCFLEGLSAITAINTRSHKLSQLPGHLKSFGFGQFIQVLEKVEGFPDVKTFLNDHLTPLKPILMSGAAKISPAFHHWNDEYFLSVYIPQDSSEYVHLAGNNAKAKKSMKFKSLVKAYKNSEVSMYDKIPKFLQNDIKIPCPLQCFPPSSSNLADSVMWYGNERKSGILIDNMESIHCVYQGEQRLVMVDPVKYGEKIHNDPLDEVDVDRVDYLQHPGLADVEYVHAYLSSGDCIYIPHRWIHQIRSYGLNTDIKLRWFQEKNKHIPSERCLKNCKRSQTLLDSNFLQEEPNIKLSTRMLQVNHIKDAVFQIFQNYNELDFTTLMKKLLGPDQFEFAHSLGQGFMDSTKRIFSIFDKDKNDILTKQELIKADTKDFSQMSAILKGTEDIISNVKGNDDDDENQPVGPEKDGTGTMTFDTAAE